MNVRVNNPQVIEARALVVRASRLKSGKYVAWDAVNDDELVDMPNDTANPTNALVRPVHH